MLHKIRLFRLFLGIAVALLLSCTLAFMSPTAHADSVLMTCTGTQTEQFSPGITNHTQTVWESRYSVYAPCLTLSDLALTGGSGVASFPVATSCNYVGELPAYYQNFYWSDPKANYSQVYFTHSSEVLLNGEYVITSTGDVSAGFGRGSRVSEVITLLHLNLDACNSPQGLASVSGIVSLTFS